MASPCRARTLAFRRCWPGFGLALVAACSPTLDWRSVRPDDARVGAMFPCRPDRFARVVTVAGARAEMQMLVCGAGGATYALSYFDVAEPGAVAAALVGTRDAVAGNIEASTAASAPLQVSGMTPNPQARKVAMTGRLPDGAGVEAQAAFFAKGLRVYQASVIGTKLVPDAVEVFFSGLDAR